MDVDKEIVARRQNGIAGGWVSTLIAVCLIALGLYFLNTDGFALPVFLLWLVITGMVLSCVLDFAWAEEEQHVIQFNIFSYDKWSKEHQAYQRRYMVDRVTLRFRFLYHWHVGSRISKQTEADIEKFIKSEYTFKGYVTKDEAMKEIIKQVQGMILSEKKQANVEYKDFVIDDSLTVDNIKAGLAAGLYDHLLDSRDKKKS